jgi:hypothetical protein
MIIGESDNCFQIVTAGGLFLWQVLQPSGLWVWWKSDDFGEMTPRRGVVGAFWNARISLEPQRSRTVKKAAE